MELVVGASTATMKSVLGKLGNLLAQEYTLLRGVRGDIQYINDELATMQAFILDVDREDQDNRKKNWMKQIRDMAYDCEDCIDDFAHRLPKDSKFVDSKCCSWVVTLSYDLWTCGPRREIASSIAELKFRAHQIAERRIRYGVDNPNADRAKNSRASAAYGIAEHQGASRQVVGRKDPVGMDDAMKELEGWVRKDDTERSVISIVGFGGVGKTTVAKALYRNVMNEFDCRAWVTVSQNYDKGAVLSDILKQVLPQYTDNKQQDSTTTCEKMKIEAHIRSTLKRAVQLISQGHMKQDGSSNVKQLENELRKQLREHLKDKRYIILVDDIWSAETWESILSSLPTNEKSSRIIATSRFEAVSATCSMGNKSHVQSIDFLNGVASKKLFDESAESNTSKHSQVPEDLWKRCGGLPLAIITMAGLAACNRSKDNSYWKDICKSLPEQETSLTLDGVTRILDCCYNDLLGDLKTCLLYLSIFPKGWKISRKCLTRRWMAEGFVSQKQGLTEEEVAEAYFNQLLIRNLIRPMEHGSNGKLKTFQVHDMVLEYIVSKAREENFITVVGGHWMTPALSNKVRRLSMQSGASKHADLTKNMNLSAVRSLTIFGSLTRLPFQAFNNRTIQVLDLDGWKGLQNKHLNDICKMLVLKYLSLRRTDITKIPSKIEKLQYLETLDIRETKVKQLPKAVYQLKQIGSVLAGSKNPRKGLRLPQEKSKETKKDIPPDEKSKDTETDVLPDEKSKDTRKSISLNQKRKDGMKGLRILSGIEIVGESSEIASLHQLTELRKLAIYKLLLKKDDDAFIELRSAISYLGICGLQTLAINDEDSDFINSLDSMSTHPRYLIALELSGKLNSPPKWISKLNKLNKLTLSVTVLRTETFELIRALPSLFSLTFSPSQAEDMKNIMEKNKSETDGEIFIPGEGFQNLKLLRLFASHVPKMSFYDNAMPALEMIEMKFDTFEGLFGIDTLEKLHRVHLRETAMGRKDPEDTKLIKLLVDDLKDNTQDLNVIIDHIVTS